MEFKKKIASLIALVGLFMFSGVIIFQLQVAFGWTNPTLPPPTGSGALTYLNGNVGINNTNPTSTLSVNGVISAMGNLVKDVATPVAGTDAVNKDYVLAQAGGGSSFVIYGTGTVVGSNPSAPGAGVPACPVGYTDILASPDYSFGLATPGPVQNGGYGPFGTFLNWGFNRDRDSNGSGDWNSDLIDPAQVTQVGGAIGTYSICSSEPNHYVSGQLMSGPNLPGSPPSSFSLPACVTSGGNTSCNTCRICGK